MTDAQRKKCLVRPARTVELLPVKIYSVVPRIQNAFEHRSPPAIVEADILAMTQTQFLNQCGADVNSGASLDRELGPERYSVGSIKTRADLHQAKIVIVAADFDNFTGNCIY